MSNLDSQDAGAGMLRGMPFLKGEKYSIWIEEFYAVLRIKDVKLKKIVTNGFEGATPTAAEQDLDELARSYLTLCIANNLKPYVHAAASTKIALEALRNACMGTEKVYKKKLER